MKMQSETSMVTFYNPSDISTTIYISLISEYTYIVYTGIYIYMICVLNHYYACALSDKTRERRAQLAGWPAGRR